MEIRPTPDQEAFILQAIEVGRIQHPEEAAAQAMALWEELERRRAEIISRVDAADASLVLGQGVALTEDSLRALAQDVRQRGRSRLAAEASAVR